MEIEPFTEEQERQILERDGYKCAVCGYTPANGVEVFVKHILTGDATVDNGQVLCENHFGMAGFNRTFFIDLINQSRKHGDTKLHNFASDVLKIYSDHKIY